MERICSQGGAKYGLCQVKEALGRIDTLSGEATLSCFVYILERSTLNGKNLLPRGSKIWAVSSKRSLRENRYTVRRGNTVKVVLSLF